MLEVWERFLGIYRRLSRLGKRPKAFRAPVSDNPLTWRTRRQPDCVYCCTRYGSIVSVVQK